MLRKIVADSGFWIALFNERDDYHVAARAIEDFFPFHSLLVPWPTLYEALNTRLIRRPHDVARLKLFLAMPSTILIEDDAYKETSLQFVLAGQVQPYSLVDQVVRSMLADVSLSIDAFIGFNPRDFFDICD